MRHIAETSKSVKLAEIEEEGQNGGIRRFGLRQALGLPESATPEEWLDIVLHAMNASAAWMMRAGESLLEMKAATKHGEFQPMLEARGIDPRRAREAMQLALFVRSLPEKQARALLRAPQSKVGALASTDLEVIDELIEEGALDGDQPLSVRDLRKRIKKLEEAKLRLESEAEISRHHREAAERVAKSRALLEDEPEWYRVVRNEGIALTESAAISAEQIRQIIDGPLVAHPKGERNRERARMAATALYHLIAGVTAEMQALQTDLLERFSLDDRLDSVELEGIKITHEEAELRLQTRDAILRPADAPKKRGPKPGSKNKPKSKR